MDWSGVRPLAGAYLGSWVSLLAGVVWTLINQLATGAGGSQVVVAGVLFVAGLVGVTGVAYVLRNRVPAGTAQRNNYQRAWQRLALGRELPGAWRAVRD
ncbi:hypothetical protein ACIBL3_23415 [Kribbella sp. NPDC050124]|uniref:hypothetical protein n=1 Tax=Kribbella sp. NPDC050124 TaxID=3364114 RepID=UPI0037B95DAA